MRNHWNALKSDFSMPESQLRAALCRITHFKKAEVRGLRGHENDVCDWLKLKGAALQESTGKQLRKRAGMEQDTNSEDAQTNTD